MGDRSPATATHATLLGSGAIVLWGLLALFAAATAGIPPFQVAAITFSIGGLAGIAVVAATGRLQRLKQPGSAALLGIGGLFGYHALYFAALKLAPPAEASLICYLWPLFIVLLSGLLPGGSLTWRHVIGACLGFAGVGVLAAEKGFGAVTGASLAGYGLAFGCAIVWAVYSVLLRFTSEAPTEAVAVNCLVCALLSAACHLLFETPVAPTGAGWLALLALGLGPVGLAFFLWDIGMKRGDVQLLGVLSYAAPVISTLALILTGAAPATLGLAGACALIVAGAVIASRTPVRSPQQVAPPSTAR